MADSPLTSEQEAEAQRVYRLLQKACDDDLLQMARLLACKPNHQLLGATALELRERVLQLGVQAVEAAADSVVQLGQLPLALGNRCLPANIRASTRRILALFLMGGEAGRGLVPVEARVRLAAVGWLV